MLNHLLSCLYSAALYDLVKNSVSRRHDAIDMVPPSLSPRPSDPSLAFVVILISLLCLVTVRANAGELSYKAINQNFGGSSFKDGILLGAANVQNPYEREGDAGSNSSVCPFPVKQAF